MEAKRARNIYDRDFKVSTILMNNIVYVLCNKNNPIYIYLDPPTILYQIMWYPIVYHKD